jgi:hypothetical protein
MFVSKEQIEAARKVGVLEYLQRYESGNIKRDGREYRLKDHDSLTVSNGYFHWHSQNVGGRTALDFLVKVRGYDFPTAVTLLCGDTESYPTYSATAAETRSKALILPSRAANCDNVIEYLQRRGIPRELTLDCIRRGSLYEDTRRNCVFVGFDEGGVPRYATMRGTFGDFKCDAPGSDKRFNFFLPPVNPHTPIVAVFESAIDVLSHAALRPDFDGWHLSLGGVSLAALTQFLTLHGEIGYVDVCTDNDAAGDACAAQIDGLKKRVKAMRIKPPYGKDWNDSLLRYRGEIRD